MTLTTRAALFAAVVCASPGFAFSWQAHAASSLDTMFPGSKALASQNWNVKANGVVQWKQMLDRFQQQQASCEPADGCGKFKALVQKLAGLSTLDQINTVGRAAHSIVYKEDIDTAGKTDFWATPYETLSTNTGDSEDYPTLAYFALRAAGMPKEAMRVLVVRVHSLGDIAHAVLAIDTTPKPVILDNRAPKALAASMLAAEYKPVLGLNEDGWWYYPQPAQ